MKSLDKKTILLNKNKLLFSKQSKVDFLEYMGFLLDSGIPPLSALTAIKKNHQGKKYKAIATDLLEAMQEGKKLIECLKGWFPNDVIALIDGYDRVGKLSEGFIDASASLSESDHTKSGFYAALAYPIAVCVLAVALMIFLNKTLLKGLVFDVAKEGAIEIPQRMMAYSHTADFLESHWISMVIGFFIFIFLMKMFLRNWSGKIRSYFDKLPFFAFYADAQTIFFFRKLGLFVNHNINLQTSLKLMLEKNTRYLKYYINCMLNKILNGEHQIAKMLDVGLIHKDYIYYLEIMEIAQQPARSIAKLASLIDMQHKKVLKRISTMLRILLFMVGVTSMLTSYLMIFQAKNVLNQYQNKTK